MKVEVRRRILRWWFAAGFVVVFIGVLLFTQQMFFTGGVLLQCKVWQFYQLEIQEAFASNGALGPTSGSGSPAIRVFLVHVGVSAIGGLITTGVGAFVNRFKK